MWLQQGAKAGRASWAEAQAVEGDEEVSRDTFLLLGVAGAQIWARLWKGQPKISWSPAKKPDAVCEQKHECMEGLQPLIFPAAGEAPTSLHRVREESDGFGDIDTGWDSVTEEVTVL